MLGPGPAANGGNRRTAPAGPPVRVATQHDRSSGSRSGSGASRTVVPVAERVGFEPTKSCNSALFKSAAFNRSATSPGRRIPRPAGRTDQGAGVGVGVAWPSNPLRSKIDAFPDGTSITVILSDSFWMYWYCRI